MVGSIEERVKEIAMYVIKTNSTVRNAAKEFKISKSTVYDDLTIRLKKVDKELAYEVKKILEINKNERNIRGGLANKIRNEKLKKQKNA